ncbi:MAG TPA: hypothetical protein VFQ39_03035 [Longimicrobium sp.]|nr:hypothetical protein [Longimicrobium sp.]
MQSALDFLLGAVPPRYRAQCTARLLFELERMYAAVDVACPRWVTRARAEIAAREGGGGVIGKDER